MDPLVALGDHRPDAEELRALRRPVAGRAGAVLLARDHDQRRSLGEVALGRLEDRHLLAARQVHRPRPLRAGDEQVAQAHVRERAAHHHLVVAAARAVGVEVLALDAVLAQVLARGRLELDRAGGRDVVGRDRVAEHDEAACAGDVLDRADLQRHALEVRRLADVGRVRLPGEALALRHRQAAPLLVAGEDVGVRRAEHVAVDGARDRVRDLLRGRPDVAEVDLVAVLVLAERLLEQVDVHPACERVGDDERRRGEVVRLHLGVDPGLEVAVAGEHGADDEVALLDSDRDLLRQRAGVSDAGRAAVADGVEAELLEIVRQARRGRSTPSRPSSRARGSS